MLDYSALAALSAVIETQGFQSAADKLFVTQSAISQRIKSLEKYYGEAVLIRTAPYRPTALGVSLLGHYKRVKVLEEGLQADLGSENKTQRISLAINRDSLETWFVPVIDELKQIEPMNLEIIGDDQEITIQYLQKGLVTACVSTSPKSIAGCRTEFMGYFDYMLVATPAFKAKYFTKGHSAQHCLKHAPAIIFDRNDTLHGKYLAHFFDMNESELEVPYHIVPSVYGFRRFALNGYAYGLIPQLDILPELKSKKLIQLFPDKIWAMPLYWHTWAIENKQCQKFNALVLKVASRLLRQ